MKVPRRVSAGLLLAPRLCSPAGPDAVDATVLDASEVRVCAANGATALVMAG